MNTPSSHKLSSGSTKQSSQPFSVQSLPLEYQEFVQKAARKFYHLEPLSSFLSWDSTIESKIYVVTFKGGQKPEARQLEQDTSDPQKDDLLTWLNKVNERHLYLVEDLSPRTAKLLGGHLNINPQFFADYIDMVIPDLSNTKAKSRKQGIKRKIEPKPWYRMRHIPYHLPPLRSVEIRKDYIFSQYIGPREYEAKDKRMKAALEDRPEADLSCTNIERVAGGHNPVQLRNRNLWPVAMTRHSLAAWFDETPSGTSNGWLKGVILLDRPFESTETLLQRQQSKYRPFTNLPSSMKEGVSQDNDLRASYLTSLLHCFGANDQLQQDIPPPIAILQDIYRIVASEWIAVNVYIARDLNNIEWQLEEKDRTPNLDLLEQTLKTLFIMRRRNRKYKALIEEQLQMSFPACWMRSRPAASGAVSVQAALDADFKQVQDLIRANDGRIAQTTDLITSVISVIEGKKSNTQNQRLTFLTILAAIALPFNSLGAILGMQSNYGPGKPYWGFFLRLSFAIAGGIIVVYILVVISDRIRQILRKRRHPL